jgi:hypothetical protein
MSKQALAFKMGSALASPATGYLAMRVVTEYDTNGR